MEGRRVRRKRQRRTVGGREGGRERERESKPKRENEYMFMLKMYI